MCIRDRGVDGFRVDAVKHMSADDVAAIMGRLSKPVERYYEVIDLSLIHI